MPKNVPRFSEGSSDTWKEIAKAILWIPKKFRGKKSPEKVIQ